MSSSVVTGPISGLSSAGVATAGMVSQNAARDRRRKPCGLYRRARPDGGSVAISTQDSQQSAVLGQPFTFTISAVSGEGPFTFINGSSTARISPVRPGRPIRSPAPHLETRAITRCR